MVNYVFELENVCVVCTGKGVCVRVSGGVRYLFCSKQAAAEGRYENTNVTVCLCVGGMRHFFCLKKQGGSATHAYARTHTHACTQTQTFCLFVSKTHVNVHKIFIHAPHASTTRTRAHHANTTLLNHSRCSRRSHHAYFSVSVAHSLL